MQIKGFIPGPHEELSWIRSGNHIECPVYQRDKFSRLKGADFKWVYILIFHIYENP